MVAVTPLNVSAAMRRDRRTWMCMVDLARTGLAGKQWFSGESVPLRVLSGQPLICATIDSSMMAVSRGPAGTP